MSENRYAIQALQNRLENRLSYANGCKADLCRLQKETAAVEKDMIDARDEADKIAKSIEALEATP